jgi:hypothetical protein
MPEQIDSTTWLGLGFTCHPTAFYALVTHLENVENLLDSFKSVKYAIPDKTL